MLSTLEREQEQLKRELKEIKNAENAVEEKLKQEEEAHLLSLKKVSKYQEQCVKMQLEKEALLQEPYDGIIDDDDETDSVRRSALDAELERMLLEELESLKEENRLLMSENLKQHTLFTDHGEGLIPNWQVTEMKTPLLLSPREAGVTSPRRNVLVRGSPLSSQQIPNKFEADDSAQDDQEEKGIHGPSPKNKGGVMSHLQGEIAMGTVREKFRKHQQEQHIQGVDKQAQTSENYPKMSINGFCDKDSHNDPLSYRVPEKDISQLSSKGAFSKSQGSKQPPLKESMSFNHNADPQPQHTGTFFEIENPVHQTLVNVEEAPISSALDALEQAQSEEQNDPRQNYVFLDNFDGEDEEAGSLNESGDIPEAERDHYSPEVEQHGEKHKPRPLVQQSENCDHRHLQRQATFTKPSFIQISPGLDGEERSPNSVNAPNACDVERSDRDYQKTGTKMPHRKQSPVIEEVLKENVNEMSLTSTAFISDLPASTDQDVDCFAGKKYRKGKAVDGGVVQMPETVSGLSTGLERNARSSQQHSYDVRQTLPIQNTGIVGYASKPRGVDVNEQAPQVRRVFNCSESAVASENSELVDDDCPSTFTSMSNTGTFNLQKGAHVRFADTRNHAKSLKRQTLPIQNTGIVGYASKPRGVDVNEQAPQVRRVLNCSESAVASENSELVDDDCPSTFTSMSNTGTFNLQKGAHVRFADTRNHAKSLKRELLKSQAALLKSHQDQHDLQDQLTAALQTEVRLQSMVDKLQTKADSLQTNLNKSAEFVESLIKDDKDFLRNNNYTAAQVERRCLQLDLQKMTRDNEELKQELQKCKQHAEILEKEHNLLQNRYDSETGSRDVKLQRRFENEASELEVQPYKNRVTGDSTADGGNADKQSSLGGTNPIRKQHDKKRSVVSWKDDIPTAEKQLPVSQADLTSLHNEIAGIKDRLSEARQTEAVLQCEVERLRKRAGSLQSQLKDSFEFVAQVQQERDSMEKSLFATEEQSRSQWRDVQRLKTDLEAAHREIEETGHKVEEREIENKRLCTQQTSNTDKLLQEMEMLKKDRRDLQSKLAWRTENSSNLVEERTFRQREDKLRTKLEEQMDRTFELENQLEENQTLVEEIERERDILQDDFTAALQTKSKLKTQLVKAKDECQFVRVKLEGSQTQVKDLRQELEEYLEQDSHVRDKEVRQVKKKLRELKTDRQALVEKHNEMKLRAENLEMICNIHKQKCKKEEIEKMKLEAELEKLKVEKQEIETRLWEGQRETGTKHVADVRKAMTTDTNDTQSEAATKSKHLRQGERPMAFGQQKLVFGENSVARGKTAAVAPHELLRPNKETPVQEDEHQNIHNRDEEALREIRQDGFGDQMRNAKETTEHGEILSQISK